MTHQVINHFFKKYFNEINPSLNPLIEHSSEFIKFRSNVAINEIIDILESSSDDISELSFHILPDNLENYSFENIERVISNILLENDYVRLELMEMDVIIDLYYKKVSLYTYPVVWVRIFFVGKRVDLSFISFVNTKLSESNRFATTDPAMWKERKTSNLKNILKSRETEPIDFFKYKYDYLLNKLSISELFDLTLLNYYVPQHISFLELEDNKRIPLFDDIRNLLCNNSNSEENYVDLGELDQGVGDLPF